MATHQLGPLVIPATSLPWLAGLMAAWVIALWRRRSGRPDTEIALFWAALLGLLAARAGFVLQHFQGFSGQWQSALDIRDHGFWWPAGLITGVLVFALAPGFRRADVRRERLWLGGTTITLVLSIWLLLPGQAPEQSKLPDIALQTLEGEPVRLHEVADGMTAVIVIWATWCPRCKSSLQTLHFAEENYRNVRFITVNHSENNTVIKRYLHQHALSPRHVMIDSFAKLSHELDIRIVPATLIVDQDGWIKELHAGSLSAARLRTLLKPYL